LEHTSNSVILSCQLGIAVTIVCFTS